MSKGLPMSLQTIFLQFQKGERQMGQGIINRFPLGTNIIFQALCDYPPILMANQNSKFFP